MAEYNPSKIIKDGNTYNFTDANAIPRSGGAVFSGTVYSHTIDSSGITINGGTSQLNGSSLSLFGKDDASYAGWVSLIARVLNNNAQMILYPNGSWTWTGTAVQLVSDQRLKQQIAEIDDKLLDAWEDVTLVQFKYNDAVSEKGDKARLHTGYVVQQIDNACKSHGVDISEYGLFCHEEYSEMTEEIEVEQKDGTKTKERKVTREANEHYSLRYTEALVVECAYLRKKNRELQAQLGKLSARLDKLEGVQTK